MSKEACVFRSPDPIATDVYKYPETRFVCRCVARLSSMRSYSDRFIGDEVCNTCEFYKKREQDDTDSNS